MTEEAMRRLQQSQVGRCSQHWHTHAQDVNKMYDMRPKRQRRGCSRARWEPVRRPSTHRGQHHPHLHHSCSVLCSASSTRSTTPLPQGRTHSAPLNYPPNCPSPYGGSTHIPPHHHRRPAAPTPHRLAPPHSKAAGWQVQRNPQPLTQPPPTAKPTAQPHRGQPTLQRTRQPLRMRRGRWHGGHGRMKSGPPMRSCWRQAQWWALEF